MKYYGIQNEVKAYINRLQDENGIFVSTSDIKTINDRVESLKRSGDWSRFSLGFNDVDGDAYLARAGVTNPLGRCEVLWFTRGVKALDLWRSMVCWPMRNYQNIGTASTVYSIGGLGVFNGTMINAPTWGINGINFDGIDDRITLPNNSFGTGSNPTSILAFLKNDTFAARQIVLSQGNNNSNTDAFTIESPSGVVNDAVSIAFTNSTIAARSLSWKSLMIGNTNIGFTGKDGGTVSSFSLSNTLNKTGTSCAIGAFGSPTGVAPFDGLISAVIRIDNIPTTQLNSNVHNLYKSTLGSNLGLP
jgi:hypothetical protein